MNIPRYFKRGFDIIQSEGLRSLTEKSLMFVYYGGSPSTSQRLKFESFKLRHTKHPGIGNPLRVYSITPQKLDYFNLLPEESKCEPIKISAGHVPNFAIVDGDWSRHITPIKEHPMYQMFKEHFNNGVPWEKTARFQRVSDQINTGYEYPYLDLPTQDQSVSTYRDYLEYLDEIYVKIRDEGYKKQTELTPSDDFADRNNHPVLNEIQVSIDKNGEYVVTRGKHRACIAKLLEINNVYVRTQVRHTQWQQIRDEIATTKRDNLTTSARRHIDHCDVVDIISHR